MFNMELANGKLALTNLPVPFFGFIVKLMQHKEINNIWHIMVPVKQKWNSSSEGGSTTTDMA